MGQLADDRDNPMLQEGVEMSIDMEEMLLDLDEVAKKKSISAAVSEKTLPTDLLITNNECALSAVMEGL